MATSSSSQERSPATGSSPRSRRASATTPRRGPWSFRPSPDRVPDRCDHGGEPCPGAPWQGLAYEQQLSIKQQQVDDSLRRLGGLDGFELAPIEPALERWRYRNKLEYSFGEREGELVLGFHARGAGTRSWPTTACWHPRPTTPAGTRSAPGLRLPGCRHTTGRSGAGVLRNLVIREGTLRAAAEPPGHLGRRDPEAPRRLHTIVEDEAGGTDGPTGALGDEYLEEELCKLRFQISHRAFFQTNTEMAERLYGLATEAAGLDGSERVFDLFCGIGTLSLVLARSAGEVWGVEIVPEAIDDAERNADLNGIGNAPASASATPAPRSAPSSEGGTTGPGRRRSTARRPLQEDRPPPDRMRGEAHRLRLQPDHPGPQRRPARGGRL